MSEEKVFYLLCLAWGMKVKDVCPPLYTATKGEKENSFWIAIQNHRNSELDITAPNVEADFAVIIIPNKRGDNLILLKDRDFRELPDQTFVSIASKLIYKERIEYEDKST